VFKYSIDLIWSDEDEGYVATIPEFPGLSAFGITPEEAVKEAKIAALGFIKIFKEDGCKLPDHETLKPFSGQLRVRIPKSLHASLSDEAKKEGISLNTYIVHLLSERNSFVKVVREIESLKTQTKYLFDKKNDTQTTGKNVLFESDYQLNNEELTTDSIVYYVKN
jgi:predicted HicB family RNase H-like nuclease